MAENETGERESAVGSGVQSVTTPAQLDVRFVLWHEQSQGNVGEIDVACSQDPARAGLERVAPAHVGHAVGHLERARVRGSRAAATRPTARPRAAMVTIPLVRSSTLMPGIPSSAAVFSPNPNLVKPRSIPLQPTRSSFNQRVPNVWVSLKATLWASMSYVPARRLRRRRWAGRAESRRGLAAGCSARTRGWRRRCRGRS